MGSQSHKRGCLCGANPREKESMDPREKESMDSELACGRVSKLLLQVAIDLKLDLIVKTLILYSGFVLSWR